MDTSTYLAQALGVVYLVVGVGMLVNRAHYEAMMKKFVADSALLHFGGIVALVIGFTIVTFHNEWVQSWEVLITIIGWGALVKGIVLLVQPKLLQGPTRFFLAHTHFWNLLVLVLGAALAYYGFIA